MEISLTLNKSVREMVQEYRHLSLLQLKLSNNGAVGKTDNIHDKLDELVAALKDADYPVRALIEEVKDELKVMRKYEHIIVFSDGGVRNHHDSERESRAASAFVLYGNNQRLKQKGRYIGQIYRLPSGAEVEVSSTLAEYAGLLQGMDYVLDNHIVAKKYIFVTDCSVMVEQILGKRTPSSSALQECVDHCRNKMRLLGNVEIKHITRENNKWADALVNDILNKHERMDVVC